MAGDMDEMRSGATTGSLAAGGNVPAASSPQVQAQTSASAGEAGLLLEAFETFTRVSTSLESAFEQLKERAERLSEELEVRNRQLKRSLRERAEARNYLRRILEHLPCGVMVLDTRGNVTLCNPVAAALLGEPEVRPNRARPRARHVRNRTLRECFMNPHSPAGASGETEIAHEIHGQKRILALSGTPLMDSAGSHIGTLHIIRDVTQIKALEEQNKRGERLSAMGEMAVELAHEIRNPLGSIELFASLLENELPRDTDPSRWASNIRIGSRSLNNIVSNMLHFANPLTPTFTGVDLHQIVREILSFMEPITSQRDIQVQVHLEATHPTIRGDRELLKQMILNLVQNSVQAMPSRGSLILRTRDLTSRLDNTQSGRMELSIEDTGLGIAPENLGRIFDPFFTTNKNGSGLGLSVVHQIVEQHAGIITVASEVNKGTVFTIAFQKVGEIPNAA
ncbi:MAG: PAS domain S-box protein [Acidobacteria bacterium]|nr:PAS domain S-box protein [Acidobacteriota bacterium]